MVLNGLRNLEVRTAQEVIAMDERYGEDDRRNVDDDRARSLAVRQISRKMYGRSTSRFSSSFVTSRNRSVAAIEERREFPSCGV